MKKHLLEAAERGDAEAQFNLGVIYENGLNDSRYAAEGNRPEAVRWLLAAAEQGLPRAQIKLAEIYAGEPDMPESSVRACGWTCGRPQACAAPISKALSPLTSGRA